MRREMDEEGVSRGEIRVEIYAERYTNMQKNVYN